jgi:hypothetical protein
MIRDFSMAGLGTEHDTDSTRDRLDEEFKMIMKQDK